MQPPIVAAARLVALVAFAAALACVRTTGAPAPADDPAVDPELQILEAQRAADPNEGSSRTVLAKVYAREDRSRALALLRELEAIDAWDYRLADDDFPTLADDPEYQRLRAVFAARAPSPEPSAIAFELDALDLLPEGVAWDPRRGELLVGSMHQRKVLAADPEGRTRQVVGPAQDGLFGVLGIEVDAARDRLWVASVAAPFTRGYVEEDAGAAAVFAFDLASGATIGRWDPPARPSQLNDLIALADGSVIVTDSQTGALLRAPSGSTGGALEVFAASGTFFGPNGLVAAADGQAIYVCDFRGVHRVELADGRHTVMATPPGALTLAGIDGIERSGDTLFAIQNVLGPGRVWAIGLSPDGKHLRSATVVDADHPRYVGPTTGAIAGDRFLYLADASLQFGGVTPKPAPPGRRHTILTLPIR